MGTKYSLQDFALIQNQAVFVDANILIYLFWSTASSQWEKMYATVFRNLLRQGNNLFVNFLGSR